VATFSLTPFCRVVVGQRTVLETQVCKDSDGRNAVWEQSCVTDLAGDEGRIVFEVYHRKFGDDHIGTFQVPLGDLLGRLGEHWYNLGRGSNLSEPAGSVQVTLELNGMNAPPKPAPAPAPAAAPAGAPQVMVMQQMYPAGYPAAGMMPSAFMPHGYPQAGFYPQGFMAPGFPQPYPPGMPIYYPGQSPAMAGGFVMQPGMPGSGSMTFVMPAQAGVAMAPAAAPVAAMAPAPTPAQPPGPTLMYGGAAVQQGAPPPPPA
jgi:hypothetical protein